MGCARLTIAVVVGLSACSQTPHASIDAGQFGGTDASGPDADDDLPPELTNLSVSLTAALAPAFAPSTLSYETELSFLESDLMVTATALSPYATIAVNGIEVASGVASSPFVLDLGINQIDVQVVASNGQTRTYVLEISRGADVIEQIAYGKASNSERDDQFGESVALYGDTLAVGAPFEDSFSAGIDGSQSNNAVDSAGAVYVFRRNGTTWAQEAYIKASNPGVNSQFGISVALSENALAVGARGEASNAQGINGNQADTSASLSGAAYVFRRTETTWEQEAYLKASNAEADDQFGYRVAMSGDTLAVTAWKAGSDDSGAVYVFRHNGVTWDQEAYVKASNTEYGDEFGSSVALSGDTLAVGAWLESSNATGVDGNQADNSAHASGAAYIFRRSGTTWTQEAYLKASNAESDDLFGISLDLSGDIVAVGARYEDGSATGIDGTNDNDAIDSGAVYVFGRTGTTWAQEAYLKASNTETRDYFGLGVAISGVTLAVAAQGEGSSATGIDGDQTDNDGDASGAVYVFRRTGVAWTQEAYLKASNTDIQDGFGVGIALSGNTLTAASQCEDSASTGVNGDQTSDSASCSGAVYLFE